VALADKDALSLDVGGGGTALGVHAPYTTSSPALVGTAWNFWLGSRYGLSNSVELSVAGFYEPPELYTHKDVTVVVPGSGNFPGAEQHELSRYGALAGLHYVHGMIWRLTGGLELGWCHRSFTDFHAFAIDTAGNAQDYGIPLADVGRDNFVVAPVAGVEWQFADHFSVSLLARFQFLLGRDPIIAFTLPLTVSYSWYL
jgi:hypothetical protein